MSSKLATNIRYFREQHHWTQQQLADKLNVSRPVIAKWESESANPDINALMKMSDLFSVSIDQLVGKQITDDWVIKEFERIYSLDHDDLDNQKLIRIIDFFTKNKPFVNEFAKLSDMPLRKQRITLNILEKAISEIDKL